MARTSLSAFLIRSAAILGALLIAAILYNHFLIDHSLERIRTALEDASFGAADGQKDAYSFQDLLISEISKPDKNFSSNLTEELFWPDESSQKSSAQFLLEDLLSAYQKNRPLIFRVFDSASHSVTGQFDQVMQFSKFLFKTASQKKSTPPADSQLDALRRARELEFQWKFDEAAQVYESFIKNYPSHENLDLIRLNLASVYLRSRKFDAAQKTLNEVRLSLVSAENVKLVSSLKKKLKEQRELIQKRLELEHTVHLSETGESAEAWFQLGVYDLHLFDLENAKSDFEKALSLHPGIETEKRTKWILSRIHLLQNDFQGSRRQMRELLEKLPNFGHTV